jgi:zinc D-Ala-D-Ala dipeptidase
MPDGFSYLEEICPDILQEIRYGTCHNFLGRPVKGYNAPRCIVTTVVGLALAAVQAELRSQGLTLKVYDAVRHFAYSVIIIVQYLNE